MNMTRKFILYPWITKEKPILLQKFLKNRIPKNKHISITKNLRKNIFCSVFIITVMGELSLET